MPRRERDQAEQHESGHLAARPSSSGARRASARRNEEQDQRDEAIK